MKNEAFVAKLEQIEIQQTIALIQNLTTKSNKFRKVNNCGDSREICTFTLTIYGLSFVSIFKRN